MEITEEGIQLSKPTTSAGKRLTRQLVELDQEDKEVLRRAAEIMNRLSQS